MSNRLRKPAESPFGQIPDAIDRSSLVTDSLPTDLTLNSQAPSYAVEARSIASIEQILLAATEHDLALIPTGGRTMLGLGMPPRRYDLALDLSSLNQVVEYEPDDFTISVEAGVTLAALQQRLTANGQFLPLDHPRFEQATVGGICAVGRGGLRRNAFGGPRDWLIGMRMIKADGTAIKGGGKVVKNVSGYDLPKLFSGSMGTLGVIAELTFKLRPLPASDQIVAIPAPNLDQALLAARAAATAAPSLNACVALSAAAAARAQSLGADILDNRPAILLRTIGLESAAAEVLSEALQAIRSLGIETPERRTVNIFETWQAVVDLELDTPADDIRLRVGLPPAGLRQARQIIASELADTSSWVIAADSGLVYVESPAVEPSQIDRLRKALGPLQGRLTVESASTALKQAVNVWGPAGPGARLMHRIKQEFDPQGILSPGRFVDGI